MTLINIMLASLGLISTLAAFGGVTWRKGNKPLKKRITRRGWVALLAIISTFSVAVYKETRIATNEKNLANKNIKQQKKINEQVTNVEKLEKKLSDMTALLLSQSLASIETSFKLLSNIPWDADDCVLRLSGLQNEQLPSRHTNYMFLHWGDEFHFILMDDGHHTPEELSTLRLSVDDRLYPLYSINNNPNQYFFEQTIRIYGTSPEPMETKILNPLRLRNIWIKVYIKTTDATRGQEKFRNLIMTSPYREIAKRTYKIISSMNQPILAAGRPNALVRFILAKGSFIKILHIQDNWAEIVTPENRQGWIPVEKLRDIQMN